MSLPAFAGVGRQSNNKDYFTYVSSGKNDTGPTRVKAVAINMLPINAASFGCRNLSIMQPQMGAVVAYNPP